MSGGRFRLGLVVGKFAPLHHGHEWLVAQAAQQSERLLILSYTHPEFDRCDVPTRNHWLKQCFPHHETLAFDNTWLQAICARQGLAYTPIPDNAADDIVHQRFLGWLLKDVLHVAPNALFSSETYSEPCAAHLSQVLGHTVHSVVVDLYRLKVPISASRIRSVPLAHLDWLSPVVKARFVWRVALLGGESTGKTTLAAALAKALGTCWVAEAGREVWDNKQGLLTEPDLLDIAHQQIEREENALQHANRFLICDTTPLTTMGYALWMFGRADAELVRLSQRSYDAIFLCEPNFPFVQDGTRRDAAFRLRQHAWYLDQCKKMMCPNWTLSGPVPVRTAQAQMWLQTMVDGAIF